MERTAALASDAHGVAASLTLAHARSPIPTVGTVLAAVARTLRHRRVEDGRSAGRVERDEEHPLEDRDPRPRIRRRRSSGATRCSCSSAVPVGVERRRAHAPRGGGQPRRGRTSSSIIALDRKTGKIALGADRARVRCRTKARTRRTAPTPRRRRSPTASASTRSSTRSGLYAYDMDGKLLWEKDLGDKKMRSEFGEGQTPVLHGNRIVVVWDHQGQSFITALDKPTGKELWRTEPAGDRQLGHAARRRARRPRAGDRRRR